MVSEDLKVYGNNSYRSSGRDNGPAPVSDPSHVFSVHGPKGQPSFTCFPTSPTSSLTLRLLGTKLPINVFPYGEMVKC